MRRRNHWWAATLAGLLIGPSPAHAERLAPPGHHFDGQGRLVHEHVPKKTKAPRRPAPVSVVYFPVAVGVGPVEKALEGEKRALDGESFEWERTRYRVRGIEAPYITSPEGEPARRRLQELLDAPELTVEPSGYDKEGRIVARVRADGQDVARVLREEGFARGR